MVNSGLVNAIAAESTALDNFSNITVLLKLNTAYGGEISLVADNDLTTDLNSNVAVSDRLFSNTKTTPEINQAVSQIGLTIDRAIIRSNGDIFLQAESQIGTEWN